MPPIACKLIASFVAMLAVALSRISNSISSMPQSQTYLRDVRVSASHDELALPGREDLEEGGDHSRNGYEVDDPETTRAAGFSPRGVAIPASAKAAVKPRRLKPAACEGGSSAVILRWICSLQGGHATGGETGPPFGQTWPTASHLEPVTGQR